MSDRPRPSFSIARIDDPAAVGPYRAFWRLGGRTFRVRVWSARQWRDLPGRARPDAVELDGGGRMACRPLDGGPDATPGVAHPIATGPEETPVAPRPVTSGPRPREGRRPTRSRRRLP